MSKDYCPLCYTLLEVRDATPCIDCGAWERGIEHALAGKHAHAEWRFLEQLRLVLCDFCRFDFYAYSDPKYFGFSSHQRFVIALDQMEFFGSVDIYMGKDKYCPNCDRRLAFLEFVEQARKLNEHLKVAKDRE